MHIVSHKAIRMFCEEHPPARNALDHLVPGGQTGNLV
jgi:hypothetical protein